MSSAHLRKFGGEATERILIVLSDGLPAPSGGNIPLEDQVRLKGVKNRYEDFDLKYEVAQASRDMTVIGVGINSPHVSEFYTQNVLCDNVEELPRLVLDQLKRNIRRG